MSLTKQFKQRLVLVVAIVASGVACAAEDTSNFYYGISGGTGEVETRGGSGGTTTFADKSSGGQLSIGYELLSNVALELRLHRLSGDLSSSSAYGFLRFSLPTSDYVSPYIMLGGGATEINAQTAAGVKIDLEAQNIDEPAAGAAIGVNLFGNEETALNLEVSAFASDDIISTFYSIGFQHYFGGRK